VLGLAAAAWLSAPAAALAQDDATEEELGPEAGIKRPAGPDQRSGHWLVHGKVGVVAPFGSIATDLPASNAVGAGPAFGGSIGLGLTRYTVLEIAGSYVLLPGSRRCTGCSGQNIDLGLGVVYHLVQGIAFDPWISYAAGYRRATFDGIAQTSEGPRTLSDTTFHGLDVARLALGGDFYPIPWLGLGLFLEVDAGTFVGRPKGFGRTAYGFFQAGLRIALDPMRRSAGPVRTAGGRMGSGI
jgi:hypothetical protein